MTRNTKANISIFAMAAFFIVAVASSASHKTFADADKWIPAGFNPHQGTLLVETHPVDSNQNNKMLEFLQKNYPWPYEVVAKNAIESKTGNYADTKKYPFAVLWKTDTTMHANPGGSTGRDIAEYNIYGNFTDRTTGKAYPVTKKTNNYGQLGYIPFFNSITKHFK